MHISEQGIALIRRCEGFSAEPYYCPAGKRTIGYGHVIREGEKFPEKGITEEEATDILLRDIEVIEQAIERLVNVPVSQFQFDALVAFVFNVGIYAFEKSTLLRLLNASDYKGAANEFGRWVYAGGRRLEGLVNRRAREAALFQGNIVNPG